MAQKPAFPGLPPGMPNPEAIFDSWWPIIIAVVGGLIYGIRQYFRGARCTSQLTLEGKVVIITGGNRGIGKYIAEDFAKRNAKIYLACRDQEAGEATAKELIEKHKNENVKCIKCDLRSLKSIREFVAAFKKNLVYMEDFIAEDFAKRKEEELHFLINNAGVMMCPQFTTEDKFEEHLQVNYLGHFLLTHLLFDTLKHSKPSRIINTTAAAYMLGEIDLEDPSFENREYSTGKAYSQSKLAVMMFTKEFAKRFNFEDVGVTMNVANPGVSNTDIHRHMPFRQSAFISLSFSPFIWYLLKHAEDGAQTTIFCSLADALTTVSGMQYKECKREPYAENADNDELQTKLWDQTLKWLDIETFGETD